MFPGVYGFTWDAGNLIFLGLFFCVATVIASTVTLAAFRAARDLRRHREESIRWQEDFHDLPEALRRCRHEMSGTLVRRTCPNGFDCRICDVHPSLLGRQCSGQAPDLPAGLAAPGDRLYHRGHTWVQLQEDGTALVGLDDFGQKVFGSPDETVLPNPGAQVRVNGTGWLMRRGKTFQRILSPLDGEVVAAGAPGDGWTLKLRPRAGTFTTTHLLCGSEVRAWLTRELERLQRRLGGSALGEALADGGELVQDLPAQYRSGDWDALWGEIFLEP